MEMTIEQYGLPRDQKYLLMPNCSPVGFCRSYERTEQLSTVIGRYLHRIKQKSYYRLIHIVRRGRYSDTNIKINSLLKQHRPLVCIDYHSHSGISYSTDRWCQEKGSEDLSSPKNKYILNDSCEMRRRILRPTSTCQASRTVLPRSSLLILAESLRLSIVDVPRVLSKNVHLIGETLEDIGKARNYQVRNKKERRNPSACTETKYGVPAMQKVLGTMSEYFIT